MATESAFAEILWHRAAIADLVHRYALYVRSRAHIKCIELFTDDAVFEQWQSGTVGSGDRVLKSRHVGHGEIFENLTRQAALDLQLFPMIHNLMIEVRQPEAAASSVMVAAMMPGGRQILGEYRDQFRLESGWRFTLRSFTQHGYLGP